MRFGLVWLCLVGLAWGALSQSARPMPSLQEQARIEQEFSNERASSVMGKLMAKHDVDLWLISQREYGEDNVFWAVKASTQFAARRRTIMVFFRENDGAVIRTDLVDNTDQVWEDLNKLLEAHDPRSIVLNIDDTFAFSDGLHAGEREILEKNLDEKFRSRIRREPLLAVDFIATRVDAMIPKFKEIMETVWAVIDEGFSSAVIRPGVTETDDVRWWFRERIQELGFSTWFHPSVNVFREGRSSSPVSGIIQRGDMLWCDIGFIGYNLHTDTQHVGYVLRENETEVPQGLKNGLRQANIMQDILMKEIQVGRTGNEILASSRQVMSSQGINGTFYSHPVGDNGHAAGPLIGYTNVQDPVPGRGDIPVIANMWYSIELQATVAIPEWGGQRIEFRQEEDMYIDGEGQNHWVYGRQTEFHLVKS